MSVQPAASGLGEEAAAEAFRRSDLREFVLHLEDGDPSTSILSEETCGLLGSNSSLVSLAIRCQSHLVCTEALGEALRRNSSLRELEVVAFALIDATNLVRGLWGNSSLRRLTLCDDNGGLFQGEDGLLCAKALGKALRTKVSLAVLHRFFDDKIGPDAVIKLGEALQSRSALQVLELRGSNAGDLFATELGQGLRHSASLRELSLVGNEMGDAGVIALAQALEVNSSLQTLNVLCNEIGPEGAVPLARALQVNASLQTLDLHGNGIGSEGAAALAHALQVNASLQTLNLSCNGIGPEGALPLARALQVNVSLQTLGLDRNVIGSQGAAALSHALQVHASLQTLNLSWNNIGPEGAAPLARALQVNVSLQTLGLCENDIGSEGAAALARALQVNAVLHTLDLRFVQIGPSGADALAQALQINTSLQALIMSEWEGVSAEAAMALRHSLKNERVVILPDSAPFGFLVHAAEQHWPPLGITPAAVADFDEGGRCHTLEDGRVVDLTQFVHGRAVFERPLHCVLPASHP